MAHDPKCLPACHLLSYQGWAGGGGEAGGEDGSFSVETEGVGEAGGVDIWEKVGAGG